jgi:hypothetical protein
MFRFNPVMDGYLRALGYGCMEMSNPEQCSATAYLVSCTLIRDFASKCREKSRIVTTLSGESWDCLESSKHVGASQLHVNISPSFS